MTHDERVRPCSLCYHPDASHTPDGWLCETCAAAYEPLPPMSPGMTAVLLDIGADKFCDMLAAFRPQEVIDGN